MFNPPDSGKREYLVPLACLLAVTGAIWTLIPGAFTKITSENYLPHGFCYMWNKQLMTLHIVSDGLIFLSYVAISGMLGWLVYRQRKQIPLAWIFVAFGLFIVACGMTHAMDIIVLWFPMYWLAGDIKLVTAIASVTTAVALPFVTAKVGTILEAADSSRQNEQRFLAASESSNDAFYILESVRAESGEITDFRFVFLNANGAKLVSSTRERMLGSLLCETLPVNRTGGFFEKYKRVVESDEVLDEEFPINVEGVNASWLCHRVVKLGDGLAISTTNTSGRKAAEISNARTLAFSRSMIDSAPIAIVATDLDQVITEFNPAAERMLWLKKEEVFGKKKLAYFHEPREMLERAKELSQEAGREVNLEDVFTTRTSLGLTEEGDWTYVRKDGSHLPVHLIVTSLTDHAGQSIGLMGFAYDITERKRSEEYISHLAHHDALTGLPNRTLLQDRLKVNLRRAKRHQIKFGLLMLDLDNFKGINDSMGHHVGDELLMTVSKRLSGGLRESDTVARMGGDEFVMLVDDVHGEGDVRKVTEKLLGVISSPMEIGGKEHVISGSIGIALFPEGGNDSETLLRNADMAMYQAKSSGRNTYRIFSPEMASASGKKHMLENVLQHAIRADEFELVYQPQVCLLSGQVTGMEALLRLRSKKMGMIMPDEFIPLAEETGLIVPIGEWALQKACNDARAFQMAIGRPITIAVNVSPRQLGQDSLPECVQNALYSSGLDPQCLELEITENVFLRDHTRSTKQLQRIREMGVRVALDDFGTGYSSMSYILRFNIDRIKIDRSFIRNLKSDQNSFAVTHAIIALAQGMKISTVAEGVEDIDTRQLLLLEGCEEAQGYLYSRPVQMQDLLSAVQSIEDPGGFAEPLVPVGVLA